MSAGKLDDFGAYRKAQELFDVVVHDLGTWVKDPVCRRLASQQLASADSICANIEEGYGRGSTKEYAHFLVIARGSAQETAGRYGRLRFWIPKEIVRQRIELTREIIAILTKSIDTLRNRRAP